MHIRQASPTMGEHLLQITDYSEVSYLRLDLHSKQVLRFASPQERFETTNCEVAENKLKPIQFYTRFTCQLTLLPHRRKTGVENIVDCSNRRFVI